MRTADSQVGAAFVLHGTRVATVDDDGVGTVWDIRPRRWLVEACAIAHRTLTRAEWQQVLPDRPYRPACA